jgi:hypothetical protein
VCSCYLSRKGSTGEGLLCVAAHHNAWISWHSVPPFNSQPNQSTGFTDCRCHGLLAKRPCQSAAVQAASHVVASSRTCSKHAGVHPAAKPTLHTPQQPSFIAGLLLQVRPLCCPVQQLCPTHHPAALLSCAQAAFLASDIQLAAVLLCPAGWRWWPLPPAATMPWTCSCGPRCMPPASAAAWQQQARRALPPSWQRSW